MPLPLRQSDLRPLSVSALTSLIKGELEAGFSDVWVEGELTGVKIHSSGHCYFSLKDAGAQISCNLWRSSLARLKFKPQDGQKVLARGSISVYEPRGTYSLTVSQLEPRGVGELQLAFEQLKARLMAEGLFERTRKRPLPFLVNRIGIVTSPTGAALRDMLQIIHRRNPRVEVILASARVQGQGAAEEIARGIERLNRFGRVQVLIVGRGGGSYEDLFCFNEELVARAIAASKIPVVSAVGHEVDITIADFVADLRAPTPSAAAELVVRERLELEEGLASLTQRLERAMRLQLLQRQRQVLGLTERLRDPRRKLQDQRTRLQGLEERLRAALHRSVQQRHKRLEQLEQRLWLRSPALKLKTAQKGVEGLNERLSRAIQRSLQKRQFQVQQVVGRLDALSPLAVLGRGYAIAQLAESGAVVTRASQAPLGAALRVRVHEGVLHCRVDGVDDEAGVAGEG